MWIDFKITDCTAEQMAYALNRSAALAIEFDNLNGNYLYEKFCFTHTNLFQDLYGCEALSLKAGYIKQASECRALIQKFSDDLVNSNKSLKDICQAMAQFFISIIILKPFAYGNHFTTRKFLVELSNTASKLNLLPQPLDFREIKMDDLPDKISEKELSHIFFNMLNSQKVETSANMRTSKNWLQLPNSCLEIGGMKFLSFNKKYLVAQNGGLIEADAISINLERFLKRGGHPNDFQLPRDAFENYLFKNEPLATLDGIAFEEEVPLICLDIDYLTGLVFGEEFSYFSKFITEHKLSVLDFCSMLKKQNIKDEILNRAAVNIEALSSFINIIRNKHIAGVKPSKVTPKFFMSMGAIWEGRPNLKQYAKAFCGGSMVSSSINAIKTSSKLYDFYLACNHHNDDYKSLTYFAYTVSGNISEYVINNRLNYFKDTSGIPYNGKYDEIVKVFRESGYETLVLSANANFSTDGGDETNKVFNRKITTRYGKKKHLVSWPSFIQKYVSHPLAQCEAALDPCLDYLIIYDSRDNDNNTASVLAKTVDLVEEDLNQLKQAKQISQEELVDKLQLLEIIRFEEITECFEVSNVDFIVNQYDHKKQLYQVLVIFDKLSMLNLIKKGALNVNAKGYSELNINTHPEHIPQIDYRGVAN